MNKAVFFFLLAITACTKPAVEREINQTTVLQDIKEVEAVSGELPRHHQKFLNSLAFIADDKQIDQTKVAELFNIFTQNAVTYKMAFDELEMREQFEKEFTSSKLLPIYKQIDSLCIARQDIVYLMLDGTPAEIDSLKQTGADLSFMEVVDPQIRNHYRYDTPDVLYGECGYLAKTDELHRLHDSLYQELEAALLSKFNITTTYYNKLNSMFSVHR